MNPVLLQKQLRDNVSDLEQFSKDLQNWGDEMKRKEESLKNSASPQPKVQRLEKQKKSPKSAKIPSKIGATDYAKWDKFDVDAECNKLDGDIEDDSELSDEIDEKAHDEAILEKDKGNKFVKSKQWDEAIKCYTKAIELYSYDPVFYANRALCHLKKNKMLDAERDCTLSLKLDKTYVKALQRRAAANEGLNNFEAAEYDLVQVLKFEPNNKESKAALDNIRRKLGKEPINPAEQRPVSKFTASRNKIQPLLSQPSTSKSQNNQFQSESSSIPIITRVSEKADIREHKPQYYDNKKQLEKKTIDEKKVSPWPQDDAIILVKAIKKPPHLRAKKQLKRIEITEIDSSCKNEEKRLKSNVSERLEKKAIEEKVGQKMEIEEISKTNESETTEKKTMQQNLEEKMSRKLLENPVVKNVTFDDTVKFEKFEEPETPKPSSAFKIKRDQMKAALDNISGEMAWPKSNEDTSTFKTDDLKILERKMEQGNLKENKIVPDTKQEDVPTFVMPKTSVQFYTMWRDAKTAEDKYQLLLRIDPSEIPNIFKEALDFNVFSAILELLSTQFVENKKPVHDILLNFIEVKRFSAFTMFMDTPEKNRLWKLVTHMREVELKSPEEVDYLIQKYEL